MILVKTQYKTHNAKVLAILKKIWNKQYYLKKYKYKIVVLTNYNNFCYSINPRIWAFVKFNRLKNFSNIIFISNNISIIVKKPIMLKMLV